MKSEDGTRYTKEMKDAVLDRMMPPQNESIKRIQEELGIFRQTLYKWRKQSREAGQATPGNGQASRRWSSEDKFLVVLKNVGHDANRAGGILPEKGIVQITD